MMKIQHSLILFLGCACAINANLPMANAQDALKNGVIAPATTLLAPDLSARQILIKSAATYASFEQYKGNCVVLSDAKVKMPGLDDSPRHIITAARSSISYQRGQLVAVFVNDGSQSFTAIDGGGTETYLETSKLSNKAEEPKREVFEDKEHISKTRLLQINLAPQASGAGTLIWNALDGSKSSSDLFSTAGDTQLLPEQMLGKTLCYVIARKDGGKTTTLWIEKDTFLLSRLQVEQGEYKSKPIEAKDGKKISIELDYSFKTYVFATEEAK